MKNDYKNSSKVFIVAKQFLMRLGIKAIINVIGMEPEIKEFPNLEELQKVVHDHSCVFIILDGAILYGNENVVFSTIRKHFPKCKLLIVGNEMTAIDTVSETIIPSDGQHEILEKFQKFFFEIPREEDVTKSSSLLSERELDVLKEVSMGYSNKEIAERLFISINTVITHRKNITEKLEIKTIAGLTVYALMNKFIRPEDSRK